VLGLAVLALGVWVLSRSDLITGPAAPRPRSLAALSGRPPIGGPKQLPISYDHFAARFVRLIPT
jgi:hypothetical protein